MAPQRVAIDLSSSTVRVLAGTAGGPMKVAEAAAPPGAIVAGAVHDGGALAPVIKGLVAQVEAKESKVMIAASDSLASFRVLSFPKETSEANIDSLVRNELPADLERMGLQRQDVTTDGSDRTVYAVAFDRLKVDRLAAAVKLAGLEAAVIELKSLCIARMVPVPTCIVLDVTVEPREIFLVDRCLPRLWHAFKADLDNRKQLDRQLASGLAAVLAFYRRLPGGSDYPAEAPVVITSESELPAPVVAKVTAKVGHPLQPLPVLTRVPEGIQQASYLACLGLIMRRR